jgi:transcriptional regulator
MYIPTAFHETDRAKLHDFIDGHSFGLLVSALGGAPFVSHLPFLLERDVGPEGCLLGHMAKANPQWRELKGQEVLAVFPGPHAYVSPTWYEAEEVVPTWNYVAVHAYGTCRLVVEPEEVAQLLVRLVARNEGGRPAPWAFDPAGDYFQKRIRHVVGFRVEVSRLEGKWKVGQNHPPERRARAARVLAESADPDAREIARLMKETLG